MVRIEYVDNEGSSQPDLYGQRRPRLIWVFIVRLEIYCLMYTAECADWSKTSHGVDAIIYIFLHRSSYNGAAQGIDNANREGTVLPKHPRSLSIFFFFFFFV